MKAHEHAYGNPKDPTLDIIDTPDDNDTDKSAQSTEKLEQAERKLEPAGRVDPLLCVRVHRGKIGTGRGHDDVAVRVPVEVNQWAMLLGSRSGC